MTTTVVNKQYEEYDVYIGRGSKWGNPFSHRPSSYEVIQVETRGESIYRFHEYLIGRPDLLSALPELKGKRLGCYCAPLPCHGDILARLADES